MSQNLFDLTGSVAVVIGGTTGLAMPLPSVSRMQEQTWCPALAE